MRGRRERLKVGALGWWEVEVSGAHDRGFHEYNILINWRWNGDCGQEAEELIKRKEWKRTKLEVFQDIKSSILLVHYRFMGTSKSIPGIRPR